LSLKWLTAQSGPASADEETRIVAPPLDAIEELWQLAQIGNMRKIREQAAYLQGLDPAYGPFATRLDMLAQGYHSKQLTAFVARFRTERVMPPA
jgi:hypothetical protein